MKWIKLKVTCANGKTGASKCIFNEHDVSANGVLKDNNLTPPNIDDNISACKKGETQGFASKAQGPLK
jgi:hypothetical protein